MFREDVKREVRDRMSSARQRIGKLSLEMEELEKEYEHFNEILANLNSEKTEKLPDDHWYFRGKEGPE